MLTRVTGMNALTEEYEIVVERAIEEGLEKGYKEGYERRTAELVAFYLKMTQHLALDCF